MKDDGDPALDFVYRGFRIEADWGPRRDTPEHIARRWLTMIDKLRTLSPVFDELWDRTDFSDIEPLSSSIDHVAERIARTAGLNHDGPLPISIVDGQTIGAFQYAVRARNTPADFDWEPRGFQLEAWCGSGARSSYYRISFETDLGVTPDPCLVTSNMARGILLAMTEEFGAEYGMAYPLQLLRNRDLYREPDPPLLTPAWWSYVGPRFTHLVEPPASAIVERRPDGALLMAATLHAFDVTNPAHRAVSDEIVFAGKAFRWSAKDR